MLTKSIRLSEQEAAELRDYLELTGEVEAATLKRAALRGLKELRLERGLLAYLGGEGDAAAARIAGLPRAEFLQLLVDKGIHLLVEAESLAAELDFLAGAFDSVPLARAARAAEPRP